MNGKCALASSGARKRWTTLAYSWPSRRWCTTTPRIIAVTNTATTDKTKVLFMSPPSWGAPLAGVAGAHHTSRHGHALALNNRSMNLYIVTGTRRGLGQALARRIAAGRDNELIELS